MFIRGNDLARSVINLSLVVSFKRAGNNIEFTIPGRTYVLEWQYSDTKERDADLDLIDRQFVVPLPVTKA